MNGQKLQVVNKSTQLGNNLVRAVYIDDKLTVGLFKPIQHLAG